MTRAKASGYGLTTNDARTVLGMQARGDRDHDIAASRFTAGAFGFLNLSQYRDRPLT
jgi:hypothetical protein